MDFIQTLWPRAKAAGISRDLFDRAFAGITEPDPVVLKLASSQPEFTSTTGDYLAKAVTPIRIDTGQQKLCRTRQTAESHRSEIWRRPPRAARHLGHGVEFRQGPGLNVRHALAGDADVCREEARLCPRAIYRGVENPEDGGAEPGKFHRLVGRRHGPHAIHPDVLSRLYRRLDGRWHARYLGLEGGRAGVDCQLSRQVRLENRPAVGMGSGAAQGL